MEKNIGAIKFLREKKILLADKTQWIATFHNGKSIDICDLFTEFTEIQIKKDRDRIMDSFEGVSSGNHFNDLLLRTDVIIE